VSKYASSSQSNLTAVLAEIAVFLDGLTIESIDRTIFAFKEGIKSHTALPADFDPRCAQLACSHILRLMDKNSTTINNMYEILKFWINLDGLRHSSNLNVIELHITCAYCMQGASNFHWWLINIVQRAIESSSCNTWIDKLASKVQRAVILNQTIMFDSAKYLPNLIFNRTYCYKPGPFRFEQMETVSTTLSSILRHWLHFPSDELSLLQLLLIDIVVSKTPSSVLFLDKIWEMYCTPFSTVFNVWNGHSSKTNIANSLAELQQ